jgi:hypothetical protein
MQSEAQVQLTQVPPKPTCNPNSIFDSGVCRDSINAYNQAVQQRAREELQVYVNRQKELASTQATAPLQQQIADLKKLADDEQQQIRKLQERMQADSAAATQQMQANSTATIQARTAAHTEGLQQGAGVGVGATLLLFGLIFGIKRLTRSFTVTKKPQVRAASV